jgi:phosphoserine phosphatase RsbU/P
VKLRTRIVLLLMLASTALAGIVALPLAALWNLSENALTLEQQTAQKANWADAVRHKADQLLAYATGLLADPPLAALSQKKLPGDLDQILETALRGVAVVDRWLLLIAVIGPNGETLAAAANPGASEGVMRGLPAPRLTNSAKPGKIPRSGNATRRAEAGLAVGGNGQLLIVASVPIGERRLVLVGRPDEILEDFAEESGDEIFLADLAGNLLLPRGAPDWPAVREIGIRPGQVRTIDRQGRRLTVIATDVDDLNGFRIGTLITLRGPGVSIEERRLVLLNTAAAVVIFFGLAGLLLYGYMRRALGPLDDLSRLFGRLAAGDALTGAPTGGRRQAARDEIGTIGRAVEIFRHNVLALQRLEIRAQLETAQQHALIRREMQAMAATLSEPGRSEILEDLRRIEATAQQDGDRRGTLAQPGHALAGPLALTLPSAGTGLGLAFRQLAARVTEQHRQLADLLAERTRDLLLVRQALEERAHLDRLREELNVARKLQLSSLPMTFPAFPDRHDFDIFARIEPAREVGGDFYDFVLLGDERLAVLIGDASGKGVAAALFIARARTLLRSSIGAGSSPKAALAFANAALIADNPSAMFATAFAAIVDLRIGSLVYAGAGHNPPYLLRAGNSPQALEQSPGIALGVLEEDGFTETQVALVAGDQLFLFSDGVTEALAPDGTFFGEERLEATLSRAAGQSPERLVAVMYETLAAFVGTAEQYDDITIMALDYYGGAIAEDRAMRHTGAKQPVAGT